MKNKIIIVYVFAVLFYFNLYIFTINSDYFSENRNVQFNSFFHKIDYVYADSENDVDDINKQIQNDLSSFDFSSLEEILLNFNQSQKDLFGSNSFIEKIECLLSGDFKNSGNNFFEAICGFIFEDILDFIPILCSIIAIVILFSFFTQLKNNLGGNGINDILHFVCFGVVIAILSSLIIEVIDSTTTTLQSMKLQMEIVFPILLTLITAVGGVVSVGIFQPSIVIFSSAIMQIFTSVLLPIFIITFIFTIVQNLSSNLSFKKFTDFFTSIYKWILGSIFTIFFAFMSINGIMANSYDSISIRTAKFTIKSYIPYVGNYLSDGFDLILSSSVLIKNTVGGTALILMLCTIIVPIIKLFVFNIGLKLVGAILEPVSDSRISSFIFSVGKLMNMLIACILIVAFMYFLTIGILMCTCNLF